MFDADVHIGRMVMRRGKVVEVDDSGPIQKITVKGLAGETFKLPLRGQGFAMTSVPPVGSVGYIMFASGRPEQAFLMGFEHADERPRNLKPGEAKMYASQSQEVHMDEDGNVIVKSPDGIVHINPPG